MRPTSKGRAGVEEGEGRGSEREGEGKIRSTEERGKEGRGAAPKYFGLEPPLHGTVRAVRQG